MQKCNGTNYLSIRRFLLLHRLRANTHKMIVYIGRCCFLFATASRCVFLSKWIFRSFLPPAEMRTDFSHASQKAQPFPSGDGLINPSNAFSVVQDS